MQTALLNGAPITVGGSLEECCFSEYLLGQTRKLVSPASGCSLHIDGPRIHIMSDDEMRLDIHFLHGSFLIGLSGAPLEADGESEVLSIISWFVGGRLRLVKHGARGCLIEVRVDAPGEPQRWIGLAGF